jgi:hypothetical protein
MTRSRERANSKDLAPSLKIGLIQTTLDAAVAWGGTSTVMSSEEQTRAWTEISLAIRSMDSPSAPNIILLPELALPRGRIADLRRLA